MAKVTKAFADLKDLGQTYQDDIKVANLRRITGGLPNNSEFREQMYTLHRNNYAAAVDYISQRITELFPGGAAALAQDVLAALRARVPPSMAGTSLTSGTFQARFGTGIPVTSKIRSGTRERN